MIAPFPTAPVTVVGAGIVGRLVALAALDAGASVTVWDPEFDRPRGASAIAAGMLAPWSELEISDRALAAWTEESIRAWAGLSQALGADFGLSESGTLHVAHARDASLLGESFAKLTWRAPGRAEWCDPSRLRALEPALSPEFANGFFCADEAHLDPTRVLAALGTALARRASIRREDFPAGEAARGVVFDCRGAHSPRAVPGLRGVRGELIRVHAPAVRLTRPVRLAHPRYPLYLVPRGAGHYVVGATEIETEARTPVTVRSALELLSALYVLDPGFAEASVLGLDVGLRPAFADGFPRIRRGAGGRIVVNGAYRHGYAVGPALARRAIEFADTGTVADAPPWLLDGNEDEDHDQRSSRGTFGERHAFGTAATALAIGAASRGGD